MAANTSQGETSSGKGEIEPPTAGLLIIGDEILKGHTKDTNSYFLLTRLWSLGVKVKAVSVISDHVDEIAQHVHDFSSRFTYVLTSGGIGPTHDDMTIQAVAKAFDEPLVRNDELAKLVANAYDIPVENLSTFHLKMAQIPSSARLLCNGVDKTCIFPLISVHNVYIFPGIPLLLQKLFDNFSHVFSSSGMQFCLKKLYLCVEESTVAGQLQEIHDTYGDIVNIGSYPEINCAEYQTKLILESLFPITLTKAVDHLLKILPPNTVVKQEASRSGQRRTSIKNDYGATGKEAQQKYAKIYSLLSVSDMSNLSSCVKGSWAVLQQALDQYCLEELCISFNGGKDCTALLQLYCAAIMKKYPSFTDKLTALYIQVDSPFGEAEDFIAYCATAYNLNIITINGNIKEALQCLKKSHPQIKAILMGTRKRDPYCDKLKLFSATDDGWPLYMRINPILNWSYSDVWDVLRKCEIPYLSLYDQGYTSIGGVHNTQPNPALGLENGHYMPAYMLTDETKERDGRT